METKRKPAVNLGNVELSPFSQGTKYACSESEIGSVLGLSQIGATYFVVPPGMSACPFHSHHVEDQMFIILSGQADYRSGADSYVVKAGDVLGAP